MNKRIVFYFFTALFVFLVSSCKKQEMETEVLNYENEFLLNSQDSTLGSLSFLAEVEVPVKYHNQEVLKNVKQQIITKALGEVYNNYPLDSILSQYGSMLFQEYKKSNEPYLNRIVDLKGSRAFLDNEITIQGTVMYLDDKILSYSYERYAYMGGAHGNSTRFLSNFDLKNAHTITEKELFTNNYESILAQLIKEQIVEDNAEMESVADLNDFDFYEDRIKPNNNFFITPDGLAYVFNPYDIAPYSTGQIGVLITYDKLKSILKQGNPIEYLYLNSES